MAGIKRTAADKWFSDYIRLRDKWVCQRCRRKFTKDQLQGLDCSHFHTRGHNMTRFNPDNAMALCYGCHAYLDKNPKEHSEFVLKRIGQEKFDELEILSKTPYKNFKKEQKEISSRFRSLFKELYEKM